MFMLMECYIDNPQPYVTYYETSDELLVAYRMKRDTYWQQVRSGKLWYEFGVLYNENEIETMFM